MNTARRMRKEAHQLMWSWLLLTGAGVFTLFYRLIVGRTYLAGNILRFVLEICILAGVPFLAALPFGSEFENRTFLLLVAQPIDRTKLWAEKQVAAIAALLPTVAVLMLGVVIAQPGDGDAWRLGWAWIAGSFAGATLWTVIARTTLGGMTLTIATNILLLIAWRRLEDFLASHSLYSSGMKATFQIIFVMYLAGAFLLGRHAFLRQQAIESSSSDEILSRITSAIVPERFRNLLRPTPSSAWLNLLRRELRLLRPVWLLVFLNLISWSLLVIFGLVPRHGSSDTVSVTLLIVTMIINPLIAFLSGVLSLGEERTIGTHDWHMTLPISVTRQWATKLLVGVVVSVMFGALLPNAMLYLAGSFHGNPRLYVNPRDFAIFSAVCAVITVLGFWASCLAKGMLKATVLVFGTVFSIVAAIAIADPVSDLVIKATKPALRTLIANSDPFFFSRTFMFVHFDWVIWAVTAIATMMIINGSFRAFRTQRCGDFKEAVRAVMPVASFVFFACLTFSVYVAVVFTAREQVKIFFRETHAAIQKIQASAATDRQRLSLRTDDLSKVAHLSPFTRKWLGDSNITVDEAAPLAKLPECCQDHFSTERSPGTHSYSATFKLGNHHTCRMTYRATPTDIGALGATCEP